LKGVIVKKSRAQPPAGDQTRLKTLPFNKGNPQTPPVFSIY